MAGYERAAFHGRGRFHIIPIKKLDEKSTLKVQLRLTKRFKVRVWFSILLIKIAAKVIGSGVDIDTDAKDVWGKRKKLKINVNG